MWKGEEISKLKHRTENKLAWGKLGTGNSQCKNVEQLTEIRKEIKINGDLLKSTHFLVVSFRTYSLIRNSSHRKIGKGKLKKNFPSVTFQRPKNLITTGMVLA